MKFTQKNEIQIKRRRNVPYIVCFKLNSESWYNHNGLSIIQA
jgi:hypothetical protein